MRAKTRNETKPPMDRPACIVLSRRPQSCAIALLIFSVAMLAGSAAAGIFYSADLSVQLEKDQVMAGGELKGEFVVSNFESAALNDAYIIAELVSGPPGTFAYPSQSSDGGSVFFEKKYGADVPARGTTTVPFEIKLPGELASGKYTLNAYLRNGRAPSFGIAHIFSSPKAVEFTVTGNGEHPVVQIIRTKTDFNGVTGPVGFPVKAGAEIRGEVFVKNNSKAQTPDLTVWAGICDWDDTACESFLSEDSKVLALLPKREGSVPLTLRAPELPGAYAIRIEVRGPGEELLSLYRSRAIVTGGTAKIWKLDISAQRLEPGKPETIRLLLGSSPDHFTFPDFNDFSARAWVKIGEKIIFDGSNKIGHMPFAETEKELSFAFTPQQGAESFTVCSSVDKDGKRMDLYCFEVAPFEAKQEELERGYLKIDLNYSSATGYFSISLCGFGKNHEPAQLDFHMVFFDQETGETLRDVKTRGQECFSDSLRVEEKAYSMILDDYANLSQVRKEFSFAETGQPSCNELGGILCARPEMCSGGLIGAAGEVFCCKGACGGAMGGITQIPAKKEKEGFPLTEYLLAGVVAVLIIAAGAFMLSRKKAIDGGDEQ